MTPAFLRPASCALIVALAASPAAAQTRPEFLPADPTETDSRLTGVAPPETPADPGPVAPGAGAGPGFVLDDIRLQGATAIPVADLAPLWADLRGTTVTVGVLETVADRISARYRAEGFVLSQAILPEQVVEDGVVTILVIEGFVDRTAVTGGSPAAQAAAGRLLAPAGRGRPFRLETLERGVLLARDTLGGTVETVLEPSPSTFGAADLTVLVTPEPFVGFATLDNRGSRLLGDGWSVTLGGSAYGLLGGTERIDLLIAGDPFDASFGYAQGMLELPLWALEGTVLNGSRFELFADIARTEPDLAQSTGSEGLTVTLDDMNLRASLVTPFIRTRSQNLFGRLGLAWRESETTTGFAGTDSAVTDQLLILNARVTWDRADRFGGVTLADLELRQGLNAGGTEVGTADARADFTLGKLRLARLQRLGDGGWSLFGELQGQAAGNVLPNSERFALGGSTIGRGFAPGNTGGDAGYGARLELRHQLAPERLGATLAGVELYAFGDYGRAFDRLVARDGDQWETLASAGIGARIDIRPWLTLTPEIVRQLEGTPGDTSGGDLETRAFIGLTARF